MSLYEQAMTDCVLCTVNKTPDGQGGHRSCVVPENQSSFGAAIVPISDSVTKQADARNNLRTYTVATHKETVLKYYDVIRRLSDGKLFRIISDNNATPPPAALNMRVVTAEKWEAPLCPIK